MDGFATVNLFYIFSAKYIQQIGLDCKSTVKRNVFEYFSNI